MYNINILIITYKQHDVIGRAIESILSQKYFGLNKIIIQDDCSPDNNWEVLKKYREQYPEIIEIYRNDTNLGIYGNIQSLWSKRGTADFYKFVSGDDALESGLFHAMQIELSKHGKINPDNKIGIFFDWKYCFPDGSEALFKQDLICKKYHPFSLFIRERCYQRGIIMSRGIIDNYKPIILNKGLNLAEYLFDTQALRLVDVCYYVPVVGSIYYANIGVSTHLEADYSTTQEVIKLRYFIDNIVSRTKDLHWLKFKFYRISFCISPSIKYLMLSIYHWMFGVELFDINFFHFKRNWRPIYKKILQI